MAKTVSDEELQLRRRARRRLIGAIALVAAVVVVLPMVLDSEPKPAVQDIDIKIPSPDAGAFTSKVAPPASAPAPDASQKTSETAGVEARQQKAAAVTEPKAAATAAKEETVRAVQQQEVVTAAAKSPAADKKAGGKPAAAAAEQFVVQVAALADAAKARQIQQKISDAGLKSYTEVVKTAKGDVTRVRAGPFATREAAEKAQKQLRTMGLDGKVVPKSR
ncbi:MAG: SPOR domain-containing protein [Burkholderiales bacterium]